MDKAYADYARADYARASVYIPDFDNLVVPAMENVDYPTAGEGGLWDEGIWDDCMWDTSKAATFEPLIKKLESETPRSFAEAVQALENHE